MRLVWTAEAWEDYLFWYESDPKKLKKMHSLIKEALKTPFSGTGKPEALKFDLAGCWSRRIDAEHRLVYLIDNDDLVILACRYHYR